MKLNKTHLNIFDPISLGEMNEVALMKRIDTKFIINIEKLPEILSEIAHNYRILEIDQNRWMTYDSAYFDTANSKFYFDHHNKILNRTKIRIRNYVESNLSFLEIKQKDGKGNTTKSRVKISTDQVGLTESSDEFIQSVTSQRLHLEQSLTNSFNRFTLVNKSAPERVTFDLNLAYNGTIFDKKLAIIELKQETLKRSSPIFQALKNRNIHSYSNEYND